MPCVYLLSEGPDGRVAVPYLELTCLDLGISVDKPDGEEVWRAAWSDLDELSKPGGRDGVVIVVVERRGQRHHQFLLPTDDPGSTGSPAQERARAQRLRTNPQQRPVPRLLTVAVVAMAVGGDLERAPTLRGARHPFFEPPRGCE